MRKIFLIVLVALTIASCKDDTARQNRETVVKMFAAFNSHDWEEMTSYYAEPAEFLDPGFGIDYVSKTRKETIEKYAGYQRIIPDVKDELISVDAVRDKIIVEFITIGTVVGGANVRIPMASIFTLKDGMIVKEATYYDNKQN